MSAFAGFDHIDCRVRSLAAVEKSFYDALMPELGLAAQAAFHTSTMRAIGTSVGGTPLQYDRVLRRGAARSRHVFHGIIERPDHVPGATRIAFRVERDALHRIRSVPA